jgi:hypothetical protein
MEYGQAEDDFKRVETNYIVSLGRLAEAEGKCGQPAVAAASHERLSLKWSGDSIWRARSSPSRLDPLDHPDGGGGALMRRMAPSEPAREYNRCWPQ